MAVNQVATLGVKVDPRGAVQGAGKAKRAITGIGKTASNVKNRVLSLQGALLGLGAVALLKSIITTASEVESLRVRLKFLTGSVKDASIAFDVMNEFAGKVPFTLEQIERATPSLLTVADDVNELNELLEITGDIAAVSGLSFEDTARQLQRSFASGIASAEMFKDSGTAAFLGFEAGVSKTGEETKRIILDMFRNSTTTAKGATKELALTFMGGVSMMEDAFRKLKLVLADSGIFEATAKTVNKITEALGDPQTIEQIKKFGEGIVSIGSSIKGMVIEYMKLPEWVRNSGIILALFGGVQGKAVLVTLGLFSSRITSLRVNMNLMFLETKKAILDALHDENLALMVQKKRSDADEERLKKMPKLIDEASKRVRALQKRIFDLAGSEGDLNIGFTTGFEADANRITDFEPFELTQMKAVTDFVPTYIEHMKKTADINIALAKMNAQINRDPREGLPEHLKHTSDEADKVTSSFFRSTNATEIMGAQFDKMANESVLAKEKIKEFADSLATNIEDSIVRMVQGLMSFKDVVKSVFAFVAQEMIRMNIAKPMASALSSIISGGFGGSVTGNPHLNSGGGGFGDFLKGMFRADGGSVTAGQPYIVGEKGAELFTPSSSGMITPNNKMGGQTINVTYSPQVNALDPRTAQAVIAENATTIVAVVRQAFNQNGQAVAI